MHEIVLSHLLSSLKSANELVTLNYYHFSKASKICEE
jgi:hypothetical protein